MQGSGVYSNPFMLLLGAKVTVGFVREGDAAGRLDAELPLPQRGHEIQRMLALTTFLGVPVPGETMAFPLWLEDHEQADALLANACRPLVGLDKSSSDATRTWPLVRSAAVGRELLRRKGGTVVLLGEAGEWAEVEGVAQERGKACLNQAGKTSLPVLDGVIARLSVLVTND